ncbi:hypothetical protein [Thiomicrorhabdus indica]|uniref:hypothetical protein n=1 Tax=Thiomicrorhabdus indica TaxID=2267253 RepID=UPI002AA78E6E|nr:hypothetical protein [Thiomicrorhabdus indica]
MFNSDISAISSVSSTTSVHSAATTAATSKYPSMTSDNAASVQNSDSISVSAAAAQALEQERQEQYALKTDPMEFYNEWLASSPRYMSLPAPKPYEELLPETQAYVDQLNERLKDATTPEQRDDIRALISGASSFGDKEIVGSDSDVRLRWQVQGTALSLMFAHLEINNEELAVPEHLKGTDSDSIYKDLNMLTREDIIAGNEAIGISREQTLASFKAMD